MGRQKNNLISLVALAAAALAMTGCRSHGTYGDTEDTCDYTPPPIPAFVQNMLDSAEWEADTICVVDGRAFYRAYDDHYRTNVIYDEDKVFLEDPALWYDSVSPEEKYKFSILMADKEMVVDFNDKASLKEMEKLDTLPAAFLRFRKDTFAGPDDRIMFSLCVDFMRPEEKHAVKVNT